jgi:hypothetical protein
MQYMKLPATSCLSCRRSVGPICYEPECNRRIIKYASRQESSNIEIQSSRLSARARHRSREFSERLEPSRRANSIPETSNSRKPLHMNHRLTSTRRKARACSQIPRRMLERATSPPPTTCPAPNINDKMRSTVVGVTHLRFQHRAVLLAQHIKKLPLCSMMS